MDKWRKLVVFEWVFIVCSVGCENVNIIVTCHPNPHTHTPLHARIYVRANTLASSVGQAELTGWNHHLKIRIQCFECDAIRTYIWICYWKAFEECFILYQYLHAFHIMWGCVRMECHFFRPREAGTRNAMRVWKVYDRNGNLSLKYVNNVTHATSVPKVVASSTTTTTH